VESDSLDGLGEGLDTRGSEIWVSEGWYLDGLDVFCMIISMILRSDVNVWLGGWVDWRRIYGHGDHFVAWFCGRVR
jgi:hypothetical protein